MTTHRQRHSTAWVRHFADRGHRAPGRSPPVSKVPSTGSATGRSPRCGAGGGRPGWS
ncbi:hypothetical protein ACRAWF_28625 [Streptomyces sp. L7]